MRRLTVLLVLCLAVIAPVAGGVGAADAITAATTGGATAGDVSASTATAVTAATATTSPPDPESDRLGWEAGYWYNESLSINQSDGLSEEERKAVVARTMARVEHVRHLEFEETVSVDVISRESFMNRSGGSPSAAFRRFDNAKFEALFLINESADSLAVQNQNTGSSVLGYYSPSQDQIVLIAEGGSESAVRIDELTLAHELLHALQDQHFNLSTYGGDTRDEVNANNGLIEGDAKFTEHKYRANCQGGAWNGTCVTPPASGGGGSGSLANIGVYFVKYFPYSDGPVFISHFYQQGGWSAVNALYDAPPKSAEQVIHPEKYMTDAPANVSLADETTAAWSRVEPGHRVDYAELGQSSLAAMFAYPLYNQANPGRIIGPRTWLNYTESGELSQFDPLNYGYSLVEGWDGDRMHVYVNGENETAYVWKLVWDSPTDAEEFANGYRELLSYWGASETGQHTYVIESGGFADAFHLSVSGDTVTIVNAPTRAQLTEVRTGLDLGQDTTTRTTQGTAGTTAEGTTSTSGTSNDERATTPGFGVVAALVAALATALLVRRRR